MVWKEFVAIDEKLVEYGLNQIDDLLRQLYYFHVLRLKYRRKIAGGIEISYWHNERATIFYPNVIQLAYMNTGPALLYVAMVNDQL